MRIAVDFDGTIVDHAYPKIGKVKLFAFETLKALHKQGHYLILWTYRVGKELDEAVEFCRQHGVEFYAVNKNYPEEIYDKTISRKINADVYIDDRNLEGYKSWSEIWKILNQEQNYAMVDEIKNLPSRRRNWFRWLMSFFSKK